MNEYTDLQVIECSRLHSEEAKSNNNENYSLWTNNLQDIVHLNPGDKVSIHGAMVSERGAGQSTSIEIKGQDLGEKHQFNYIELLKEIISPDRIDNSLPSRASKMSVVVKKESLNIRDDELKFVLNYFIPANCTNSCHLPRRWMYSEADSVNNYKKDDGVFRGFTWIIPRIMNHGSRTGLYQSPQFYNTRDEEGQATFNTSVMKPRNDNSRYTLMIRDHTYYSAHSASGHLANTDFRDPENATYYPYAELKNIKIPHGFNSPESIATEISSKLQNIVNDETLYQRIHPYDKFPQPVSKLLESETYKAFYSGNIEDMTKEYFLEYFNLSGDGQTASDKLERPSWTNPSGYEWLRQYGVIATKYPELYENGRLINRSRAAFYTGIMGAQIASQLNLNTATKDTPFELDIKYNKARCDEFKRFFDAQKLYPEIIENLNDANSGYIPGNSVDNTRWIHINRYDYSKQDLSLSPFPGNDQLGWGGYYYPRSWTPSRTQNQLISLLLCLYFDSNQENTFHDNPNFELNQFTYGCLGRSDDGNILIYPLKHEFNGIGTPQIEELRATTGGIIEYRRKIGFDLHFTAPGMYYLLPLSGWSKSPEGYAPHSNLAGDWNIPDTNQNGTDIPSGQVTYNLNHWKKLLYIGADNPQLNWNGTNFAFSNFHTGKNRGNNMKANKNIYATITPRDQDESDTIYEINPRNLINDYTPDRMPYTYDSDDYKIFPSSFFIGGNGDKTVQLLQINDNYEPWTIYDQLCGIMIQDFGVPEHLWTNSLWGILGFSYKQFHGSTNRQVRIQRGNVNDLSVLTTNAEVVEGDTKILSTNWIGTPMYNNMITTPAQLFSVNADNTIINGNNRVYPNIVHKTESMQITAEFLPTRMIRGYYTIRSNILQETPFIGGKVNNTNMPIIGIVDKINGDGDFYFGQESSLQFTITKPMRLASLTCSIHDPDGSYAKTSEQNTVLFKIQRERRVTYDVAQEILAEEQQKKK